MVSGRKKENNLQGGTKTVAKERMTLLELLRKSGADKDLDFLREGVKALAAAIMELEVTEKTGASLYERSPERTTYRSSTATPTSGWTLLISRSGRQDG